MFCTFISLSVAKILEKHIQSSSFLVQVFFKKNSHSHGKFTERLFLLQFLYWGQVSLGKVGRGGHFSVGNFPWGIFPGGKFLGSFFPEGFFPRCIFTDTGKRKWIFGNLLRCHSFMLLIGTVNTTFFMFMLSV